MFVARNYPSGQNFVALMKTRKAQTIHQLPLQNPAQMESITNLPSDIDSWIKQGNLFE
jgi:hypothetical protein